MAASKKMTNVVIGEPTIDETVVANLEAVRRRIAGREQQLGAHFAEVEQLLADKTSPVERQIVLDAAAKVREPIEAALSRDHGAEENAQRKVRDAKSILRQARTEPAVRLVELARPMVESAVRVGDLGTLTIIPVEAVHESTLPGIVGSFRIVGTDSPLPAEWWEAVMRQAFKNFGVGPYGRFADEWSTPIDFTRNYEMTVERVSFVDLAAKRARDGQADARARQSDLWRRAGYFGGEVGELPLNLAGVGVEAIDLPSIR